MKSPGMMKLNGRETEELLSLAQQGDERAIGSLFERHRDRLRRMVAARLDRRVASRVDASDIVQEAMGQASQGLPKFLRTRAVPYYTWLRRLTLLHLAWSHRFHLGARKRSAARDQDLEAGTRTQSSAGIDCQPASDTSPSQHAIRDEECERVRAVFDRLPPPDRAFLELRYIERLSLAEIAERLGLGPSAVKMRHLRALKQFRGLLEAREVEPAP
jgi:RNA polymerase sigma-70 factor (ECF subfamily)